MHRRQKASVSAILALALCLVGVAWLSSRTSASQRFQFEQDTRAISRQFASRMLGGLEHHYIALNQMTNFWKNSEEVTEQEFYDFAEGTHRLSPLCLRIVAIDASRKVRWVYPPGPNRDLVGFDVRSHPKGHETLLRAIETRAPVLSPPLELVGGAQGFVLTAPVFRNGRFLGAVVCSFQSSEFFQALILPEVRELYEQSISDSGVLLHGTARLSPRPSLPTFVEKIRFGGRIWELRVQPRPEVARSRMQSGQAILWTFGSLLSVVIACAAGAAAYCGLGTAQKLRTQDAALQATRQRLDSAMGQLLQSEKMTALGELVAGVAHEVNNPLASILGYGQLLSARDLAPDARRYVDTICSEADRAGKIVRNLLTFARKHPPEKKYLGLNGIVEKTLELKAYHFRSSQIEVDKDLAADLPLTMLDFHQIQQVILNLLNNAEQAMGESGRGGRIHVSTRAAGDRLELRVSDTGPGIPPEIQDRIFEPFFTTKKEGKGTGLGLSLCYGIVQEHGGTIAIENGPEKGATFLVRLPVLEEPPALPLGNAEGPAGKPASGLRLLVIDDEPSIQNFLVDLLRSRGHAVDTASDVPEAIRKIERNGHDVIISDMKMPRGTGKDIYAAAARRSPLLARRIIFTTGDGASAATQQFVRETGNEVLLKPCRIEEIEQAIARATRG
jgi:signal transduction histidine kinase/CheY-like chemotaxis protein